MGGVYTEPTRLFYHIGTLLPAFYVCISMFKADKDKWANIISKVYVWLFPVVAVGYTIFALVYTPDYKGSIQKLVAWYIFYYAIM